MRKSVLFISIVLVEMSFAWNIRSSVAARQSAIAYEGEEPEIPYVTDGLVAMYDGIWNNGIMRHSDNIKRWKNLVGDTDGVLNGMFITDSSVRSTYSGYVQIPNVDSMTGNEFTYEIAVRMHGYESLDHRIFWGDGTSRPYINLSGGGIFQAMTRGGSDAVKNYTGDARFYPHAFSFAIGNGASLYADGVHVRTVSYSSDKARSISMPRYGDASSLDIEIWCIRIYDKILSQEEVEFNHVIDLERFGL